MQPWLAAWPESEQGGDTWWFLHRHAHALKLWRLEFQLLRLPLGEL